ncbi:MAG TPA: hypothetical protein DCX03_01940 [Bacteroidales bacterium]|nr:hypothetical protein [Bacteroidales bacterium]
MQRSSAVKLLSFAWRLIYAEVAGAMGSGRFVIPQKLIELGFKCLYSYIKSCLKLALTR